MSESHEKTTWTPHEKQHNNRKITLGRQTQVIQLKNGKTKTIRHETNNALNRKVLLLSFYERILTLKSKWHKKHPEYQKKKD